MQKEESKRKGRVERGEPPPVRISPSLDSQHSTSLRRPRACNAWRWLLQNMTSLRRGHKSICVRLQEEALGHCIRCGGSHRVDITLMRPVALFQGQSGVVVRDPV